MNYSQAKMQDNTKRAAKIKAMANCLGNVKKPMSVQMASERNFYNPDRTVYTSFHNVPNRASYVLHELRPFVAAQEIEKTFQRVMWAYCVFTVLFMGVTFLTLSPIVPILFGIIAIGGFKILDLASDYALEDEVLEKVKVVIKDHEGKVMKEDLVVKIIPAKDGEPLTPGFSVA